MEKKEVKKMGRFIHFALAAADEAMQMSGLKVTAENDERVGVHIGSGIGGFDIIEREHTNLMEGGPRRISPFFIPSAIINLAAGQVRCATAPRAPTRRQPRLAPPARTRLETLSASFNTMTLMS